MRVQAVVLVILSILFLSITAIAETPAGRIHGHVRIKPSDMAARNAVVTIVELKRSVLTDENGAFEFKSIPAGKYQMFAHLDRVPDVIRTVEVTGGDLTVDFELSLTPVSEQVTVTATGSAESVGTSYHSVVSVGALELAQRNPLAIGDALESQLGVAKRSFGPGSGRPVIRGFDGDRVLVLQDGLRVEVLVERPEPHAVAVDLEVRPRIVVLRQLQGAVERVARRRHRFPIRRRS